MTEKELSELTDQELLDKAKKTKSAAVTNALFIGILVGIVIYSVFKSTVGLVTIIPLFLIYKLVNNAKGDQALEKELAKRNLK